MKCSIKMFAIFCIGMVATSCASVQVDPLEIQEIKKVAFVGFEIFRRTDGALVTIVSDASSSSADPRTEETSLVCYETCKQVLSDGTQWVFLSNQDIASNTRYRNFYEKAGRTTSLILDVGKRYHVDGIATGYAIRKMDHETRNLIMDALDVDALVTLEVLAYPGKTSSTMNYSYVNYRMTVMMFDIYTRNSDTPVVTMKNVVGKTAKDGHSSVSLPFVTIQSDDVRGLIGASEEVAKKIVLALKE